MLLCLVIIGAGHLYQLQPNKDMKAKGSDSLGKRSALQQQASILEHTC